MGRFTQGHEVRLKELTHAELIDVLQQLLDHLELTLRAGAEMESEQPLELYKERESYNPWRVDPRS